MIRNVRPGEAAFLSHPTEMIEGVETPRKRPSPPNKIVAVDGCKLCARCKEMKPLEDFHRSQGGPLGRHTYCKVCRKAMGYGKELGYGYHRKHHLKSKFGITVEDYDRMLAEQGGGCAICGEFTPGGNKSKNPDAPRFLHIDHDHKTGKVRALLCSPCNQALGRFRERPDLMEKGAAYIRYWRERLDETE